MVTTVLFDLDGTLLDTLDDLADTMNYILSENGYPQRSRNEIRAFVGNGIKKLVERALPTETEEETVEKLFTDFKHRYAAHMKDKTAPYSGICDLLASLSERKLKIGIVSNKVDEAVKALCEYYFSGLYDIAVGESDAVRKKPAPDTANAAMHYLGSKPKETVYIGDSDVDIKTAQNAGIRCISVLWGFRDKDFLEKNGAAEYASAPSDILKLI